MSGQNCKESFETLKYSNMYFSMQLIFYVKYFYDAYLARNNLYDMKKAINEAQSIYPIEGVSYHRIRIDRVGNNTNEFI